MSDTAQALLTTALVLSTSVWVGGYVAIAVVARTATTTLDPDTRVRFFRSLGRSYFWVGTPALVIALACAAVLLGDAGDDGGLVVTGVTFAVILVAAFAVAVDQARRMTRLRQRLLSSPDEPGLGDHVRRGARAAGLLRALLGILSIALVVLGSVIVTR